MDKFNCVEQHHSLPNVWLQSLKDQTLIRTPRQKK